MSLDGPGPGGAIPPADVRAALARVLRSSPFARSPQLQRFISFVVEETLAGRGERLKEYVIGLEVFARPASYDPRIDSLVRVEARRLRAALASYYATEGGKDPVVIDLQKGSYLPSFVSHRPGLRDGGPASESRESPPGGPASKRWTHRRRYLTAGSLALAVIAAVAVGASRFLHSRSAHAPTERGTVLIAGFVNSTGEAIFDETLRQGLATELEQSPFLELVSERRVAQTLNLMGRRPSDRLDGPQTRDLCLRAGAKVAIAGSIDRLGSQYVLGLTVTDCGTGDDVLHVQEAAPRKEAVLRSLTAAARTLRGRLGESIASVRQFGIPVEEATTSSLEALQAFSLGRRTAREKGSPGDIPFYRRALEIAPDFAAAHAALGVSYVNQGQPNAAAEHLEKAYRLRDRVSERERYRISAYYYQAVTGELDKASEVYELWKQTYPRDVAPHVNLGLARLWLGEYEKALADTREAVRLEPGNVLPYTNLAAILIKLERPQESRAVLDQAMRRGLVSKFLRLNLCYLAILANETTTLEQQLAQVRDAQGDADALLSLQSDSEAYHGRLRAARALSGEAAESARRAGAAEAAANWLLNAALREAELGNRARSRGLVRESLGLSAGRDVLTLAALASARSGDLEAAGGLLRKLEDAYPRNSLLAKYWMPTIRAACEIGRRHPAAALRLLQHVGPYEYASPPPIGLATLYPVYLRGEAHLLGGNGPAAAGEFQKILARPGLVLNFPLGALAHLQLARAYRLSHRPQEALGAYDSFLTLWKEADPDIPVLKEARAERGEPR